MVDKPDVNDPSLAGQEQLLTASAPPRQSGSHRAPDMRDTMAELTERAQLISREAGSKVALAMKDVIAAAAGLAGFAIESARDLVQYMVRRGQMSQEEADRLIREAEEAHSKRPESERARPSASKLAAERAASAKAEAMARAAVAPNPGMLQPSRPMVTTQAAQTPAGIVKSKGKSHSGPGAAVTAKSSAAKRSTPSSTAAASAKPQKKVAVKPAGKASKMKAASKNPKKKR